MNKIDNPKKKLLWVGDAAVPSGFAACTHAVCDYLYDVTNEWDINVLGLNYFGDPHSYSYPIYPCRNPLDFGYDGFGTGRLPLLINRLRPDIVVFLADPWNIKAYVEAAQLCTSNKPKLVGWIAVDGENQKGEELNCLDHVIVWTKFAEQELRLRGCTAPISIVPLGVDTHLFSPASPQSRFESRSKVCPPSMPSDAFLVGTVGRNQPRKRLDLTIEYFAEWIRHYSIDNAYLYLHVAPTGDRGIDIHAIVKYHGIQGKVILASPPVGKGIDPSLMHHIYNSFDVYLSTAQGEGWGLPVLEAMASGVPCIVPNWSGLGSWIDGDSAIKIECTSIAMNAPLNGNPYIIGGIPDKDKTIQALNDLYASNERRDKLSERGLALANCFTWHNTAKRFEQELVKVLSV